MILAFDLLSYPTLLAALVLVGAVALTVYAYRLPVSGPGEDAFVVRLIARCLPHCTGKNGCPCGRGWRRLVGHPFVYPPLVLGCLAVGQLWDWAQPVVGVYLPAALLVVGWVGCVVRYRDNRHADEDEATPDLKVTTWDRGFGHIPDAGVLVLVILGIIELFRIQFAGWPLPDGWNRALDDRGGLAAEGFRYGVLLWLIAIVILWPIRALFRRHRGTPAWNRRRRFVDVTGAVFSGAALALVVACAVTYYAEARTDPSRDLAFGRSFALSSESYRLNAVLAATFAPRVAYDTDERWELTSISRLRHARPGVRVRDMSSTAGPLGAPTAIFGIVPRDLSCRSSLPCYQVDLRRFGHQDCTKGRTATRPSCPSTPAVYARVLRSNADGDDFPTERIPGPPIGAIIEYWEFYGYDSWKRETPPGVLYQFHDGDWEAVLVAVSPKRRPMWVAYTSHCGGVVVPWRRTHVWNGTHPYDFVAIGSHGNYPNEAPHTPDWMGCAGRKTHAGRIADTVDSLSNIREQVDAKFAHAVPGHVAHVLMAGREHLLTAPIWWGTLGATTLTLLRHPFGVAPDTGPESPGCKPLWRQPIGTIYCDKRWDTSALNLGNADQFCSRWKTSGLDCTAA